MDLVIIVLVTQMELHLVVFIAEMPFYLAYLQMTAAETLELFMGLQMIKNAQELHVNKQADAQLDAVRLAFPAYLVIGVYVRQYQEDPIQMVVPATRGFTHQLDQMTTYIMKTQKVARAHH